jgi:hypothetical protein
VKNPIRAIRARRHARRLAAFRANLPCSDETLRQIGEDMRRAFDVLPTAEQYVKAWTAFARTPPPMEEGS